MTNTATRRFDLVPVDLYRNIHKGIRAELFAITATSGSLDADDAVDVAAHVAHIVAVGDLLSMHADHEHQLDELLHHHLPDVAEQIDDDHARQVGDLAQIVDLAAELVGADAGDRRTISQLLYLDLASFTGAYLAHQDVEERLAMPALHQAVGPVELAQVHRSIVGSIPPEVMARSLSSMLPAMNIDDRVEHLAGMRQSAPADGFERVWDLVTSVLAPRDVAPLADRLGVAR